MREGGRSGDHTRTGLVFEKRVSLKNLFRTLPGYMVTSSDERAGLDVMHEGDLVARLLAQHDFYRYLDENGVNWREVVSKQLLPDDGLLVIVRDTLFILEVKFQKVAGSVDEKLQTCDSKESSIANWSARSGFGWSMYMS